jgi:hypothetical protein
MPVKPALTKLKITVAFDGGWCSGDITVVLLEGEAMVGLVRWRNAVASVL